MDAKSGIADNKRIANYKVSKLCEMKTTLPVNTANLTFINWLANSLLFHKCAAHKKPDYYQL
ncbi:hypothetical protein T03_4456 [Trichinella britovi]|uniref:Uncharacterized protein n=1 Tax=Trichinella britovi TaxID=45882 RepID=A0A0V1CFJ7_TRIBR|nr:hypothetical protein T03_4456 [Trichinella britovi]